jgi:hypothetical protein
MEDLGEVLWYDFIPLKPDGAAERDFALKSMILIDADVSELPIYRLEVGQAQQFLFVYGMLYSAGNTYQDREFGADIAIRAVQDSNAHQAETDALQ